ncbi:MAG: type IV pilus biogenesis/stability protein PilW [Xanthomonadales bacterium]|nr:type IV pilus biogenesis/stability protein PilW [Xanthomonadales bacterium]
MKQLSRILVLAGLSVLSACASNPQRSGDDRTAARQAAEINTSLGQEYMSRGQNEVALEKLKKATNADPSYAPAHTLLAILYERINELELAERHYRSALDAAPRNGDVNNNYGVYLCKSGRLDAAEKHFELAVKDPFYRTPAVAYANAGSCYLEHGILDKAERFLRQSLEYDAEFPDALLLMANVSQELGAHLRARAFLQRFEATGSETPASLALGIRIENSLGNAAAADSYRQRLLRNHPGSKQAAESLGRMNS